MHYGTVIPGIFQSRPNRFIALVETAEGVQIVHVKNTGRCRELLVPGATVYLEQGTNPGRKTAYDLIAVEKGDLLINMDAQAPNKVFAEWAEQGGFVPDALAIHPEYRYGFTHTGAISYPLYTGGAYESAIKGAGYGVNVADLTLEATKQALSQLAPAPGAPTPAPAAATSAGIP